MIAKIGVFILIVILSSCDSPRSQRTVLTSSNSSSATLPTNNSNTGINLGSGVDSNFTTTPVSNANVPVDATHCKFSADGINGFESTSAHLGSYTLCQSSIDKNIFYVQFKTPPVSNAGDVSICFIPHTTTGTNSIYIGNPMCGDFPDPKAVKKITFVKFSTFNNALINSVLFFKDTSYFYPSPYNATMLTLTAYQICMNQLSIGNASACNAFKSVNQYVLKTF